MFSFLSNLHLTSTWTPSIERYFLYLSFFFSEREAVCLAPILSQIWKVMLLNTKSSSRLENISQVLWFVDIQRQFYAVITANTKALPFSSAVLSPCRFSKSQTTMTSSLNVRIVYKDSTGLQLWCIYRGRRLMKTYIYVLEVESGDDAL